MWIDTYSPIVLGHGRIIRVHVSVNEILSPNHVTTISFLGGNSQSRNTRSISSTLTLHRSRTWLIITIHDVGFHSFSTIATISCPVVIHIVAQVGGVLLYIHRTVCQSWCTRIMVCQEIVVIGSSLSTPVSTISMCVFSMGGMAQAL